MEKMPKLAVFIPGRLLVDTIRIILKIKVEQEGLCIDYGATWRGIFPCYRNFLAIVRTALLCWRTSTSTTAPYDMEHPHLDVKLSSPTWASLKLRTKGVNWSSPYVKTIFATHKFGLTKIFQLVFRVIRILGRVGFYVTLSFRSSRFRSSSRFPRCPPLSCHAARKRYIMVDTSGDHGSFGEKFWRSGQVGI